MEVEVNSHMSARGFLQTCLLVLLHVWLSLPDARSRWPNRQVHEGAFYQLFVRLSSATSFEPYSGNFDMQSG